MLTMIADGPIETPGVYEMTADAYHADPVPEGSLSSTRAKKLMEPAGPARYHYEQTHPKEPKKVFDIGHAAHTLALGVGEPLAVYPAELLAKNGAVSTDAAKAWEADMRATGITPLKQAEFDKVEAMAEMLQKHPEAMEALAGDHEVSVFRRDQATGVWLRGRLDCINPEGIGDYKTVPEGGADPRMFGRRTAAELGYYMQADWYLTMRDELDLPAARRFRFVLQEKVAPYLPSVVELSDLYLSIGHTRNRAAIDLFAKCRASGIWPGFTGVTVLDPPKWLVEDDDEQLAADIEAELAAYAASLKEGHTA